MQGSEYNLFKLKHLVWKVGSLTLDVNQQSDRLKIIFVADKIWKINLEVRSWIIIIAK